jgi:hypothetical protein
LRTRFDRELAYSKLKSFVASPSHEAQEDAYLQVDELVEVAVRASFSRCPDRNILDDLRQAARLRLYQSVPKLAELCTNSEYYFRLSLSIARRAMLSEYARLKHQSRREVIGYGSVQDVAVQPDFEGEVALTEIPSWDTNFALRENELLLDQVVMQSYQKAKDYLVSSFSGIGEQHAAVFCLLMAFEGRGVSTQLLQRVFGVSESKHIQDLVNLAVRKALL